MNIQYQLDIAGVKANGLTFKMSLVAVEQHWSDVQQNRLHYSPDLNVMIIRDGIPVQLRSARPQNLGNWYTTFFNANANPIVYCGTTDNVLHNSQLTSIHYLSVDI